MASRNESRNSILPLPTQYLSEFIRIYQENEPLWNLKHPDYMKPNVRAECYEALVDKMQEYQPDTTREDVVKKINSIRCSFRKEYRKVQQMELIGKTYTPKLWYYKQLLFLLDQEPPTQYIEHETYKINVEDRDDPLRSSDQETTPPPPSFTHNRLSQDDHSMYTQSCHAEPVVKRQKKLSRKTETHADIFGRHVAAKLNSIRADQRVYLEKLINDAIFEAELGNLSRDSQVVVE